MAIELRKKQVQLSDMAEQETVQIVKERDLIVPDGKPDIQRVMYVDGKIKMEQMDIQEGRVVYKGQVDVIIVYVPENNPQGICKIKGTIPLEDFVMMDGIDQDKEVEMDYEIEHMHWSILNERKINVKAIIKLLLSVMGTKELELVTEATNQEGMQVQTNTMQAIRPMQSSTEEFMIKDELTIPQGKPSIDEVLNVSANIQEEQVKRTEDEIIYSGMVEVCVMYSGVDENLKVEVVKQCIPFNYPVTLPQVEEEMYWDYELSVDPSYIQIMPDFDGEDRVLDVECTMKMKYKTYEQLQEMVLDDVYCPGKKVDMKQNKEKYMTMAGKINTKIPKKEMMAMNEEVLASENIFNVELRPTIEMQEVVDDKLTINGMVEVKVVYTTPGASEQIHTKIEMIPFGEQIQVPGMTSDSNVNIHVTPKNANVSTYNKSDMMLEYIMDYEVDAFNEEEINVIESVEMTDIPVEEMNEGASMTVYVVKKGDSLWKIAKKYNTTVQEILEVNDIDHPTTINPGQKLIIMKKTKF